MKTLTTFLAASLVALPCLLFAQVPQLINYQGRVAIGGTNFNGNGLFKFALVNSNATATFWSNDGTSSAGSQPTAAVTAVVSNGLYAVLLGDSSLANMTSIPPTVFTNGDVRLRVWFNDGANGSQLLTPDQRIAAVGYAMMADNASTANTAANFSGALAGDVTGTQGATAVANVGGQTAANVASGASAANAATSANTAGAIVKRDGSGNFLAGTITGTLSGNAATATTANNFSGALSGNVTGTQSATVVSSVGGQSAANVASGASAANAATSANTANTIVKRDASGNFTAGAVTGTSFTGNGAGLTSLNGANLVSGSVGAAQIGAGAVGNTQLAANSVQAANISAGAVGSNQLASGAAVANLNASGQSGVAGGGIIFSSNPTSSNLASAGYLKIGKTVFGVDTWDQRNSMPLAGRYYHSAVWTGSEMILWGGVSYNGSHQSLGDGARFNHSLNTWTLTTTNGAPTARYAHTAVWTGTEMIVWGGYNATNETDLNDGARYNPQSDTWTATSTNGAPSARDGHTAVWTGSEMILWGGAYSGTNFLNLADGARYNPTLNTWAPVSTNSPLSGRVGHRVVWTGSKMIVWGGYSYSNSVYTALGDGAVYDPTLDTWTLTSASNAPSPRYFHTAVWTGTEMIIWGGYNPTGSTFLGDGKRYNAVTDTWSPMTTSAAPTARQIPSTVWTGTEMIVWAGYGGGYLNTGARYSPSSDSWQPTTLTGAPPGRHVGGAVWTGAEMIISGGSDGTIPQFSDTFSYTPPTTLYLYLKP